MENQQDLGYIRKRNSGTRDARRQSYCDLEDLDNDDIEQERFETGSIDGELGKRSEPK